MNYLRYWPVACLLSGCVSHPNYLTEQDERAQDAFRRNYDAEWKKAGWTYFGIALQPWPADLYYNNPRNIEDSIYEVTVATVKYRPSVDPDLGRKTRAEHVFWRVNCKDGTFEITAVEYYKDVLTQVALPDGGAVIDIYRTPEVHSLADTVIQLVCPPRE